MYMSNARSARHIPERQRVNLYRVGAVLAQLGSFATTYAFIAAAVQGLAPLTLFLIAVGVELLLMLAKGVLFNASKKDDLVGWCAIVFDTLLNAGGLWPLSRNIATTPSAIMLAEALGLKAEIGNLPALALALVFGYLLAVLPHHLWRAGGGDQEA
jgi:hypothetical protein